MKAFSERRGQYQHTKAAVCEFAGAIGIHPGIIVGRLQHDGLIESSWMNDLRESFRLVAAE